MLRMLTNNRLLVYAFVFDSPDNTLIASFISIWFI